MNIKKTDVLELRRRMTKKDCTISRLSGCYVNGERKVILKFNEPFSQLEEEEFYKYLEMAKKVLSGTMGGNLLELNFQHSDDGNEHQRYLYTLKASKLQNEELLDRLYEQIIEHYQSEGNYLILVFHDIYDVIARGKDNQKLDESSEVFEYMICAVCPVDYSKPGLGYREQEGRIGVCDRNWLVGQPELGFLYPAFSNHSADSSAVMYYVKTGKGSHPEFAEKVLCCTPRRTAGEEKSTFRAVVEDAFAGDDEQAKKAFMKIQKNLSEVAAQEPDAPEETPPVQLTEEVLSVVISDVEMPEETRRQVEQGFKHHFKDTPPQAQNVVDKKLVEESAQRMHTAQLEQEVTELKQKLEEQGADPNAEQDALWISGQEGAVELRVSEEKAQRIRVELVDGQKCILVPLEKGESALINGVEAELM